MKGQQKDSSAVVDGLLRFIIGGTAITTILVAPGMARVIDRPLYKYFQRLDKRTRERELKRALYYMKRKELISVSPHGYEHGIKVTKKGSARLRAREFDTLAIKPQRTWDQKWRIVFFDIPEENRHGRRKLISKLKQLGFNQLQRSVWVYPFPCRAEVGLVATAYDVYKFVSYIEATGIDSPELLKERFSEILT